MIPESKEGVSIIVCCYNSAERLPKTIEHLAKQQVPDSIQWEVIVVDNASTDDTEKVARCEWDNYQIEVPFTIIHQSKAGLSFAREKGVQTAKYEYCLFCDDDNWLQFDYVKTVFSIMHTSTDIGVLGGRGEAECEEPPPSWFEGVKKAYGVGKQAVCTGDITHQKGHVYGAGMVIRRKALKLIKRHSIAQVLTDRVGEKMTSGGDTELCMQIRMIGFKVYYCEDLVFKHFISKNRLKKSYYRKMSIEMAKAYIWMIGHDHIYKNRYEHGKSMYWLRDAIFMFKKSMLPSFNALIKRTSDKDSYKRLLAFAYYLFVFVEFIKQNRRYDIFLKDMYSKKQCLI